MSKLMISCSQNNCGEQFMDSICEEYEKHGWYMKYAMHQSFIWRHLIIISNNRIKDYLPHNKIYQCGWFKTSSDSEEFKVKADAFINLNKPKSWWKNIFNINKL